jgi:hypothetical protein
MDLRFSSTSSKDIGSFKLLELPPDLLKLIESGEQLRYVPPIFFIYFFHWISSCIA